LYRGQWTPADGEELERALGPLRARLSSMTARELPAGRGSRNALVLEPLGPCPRIYPRAVGLPSKQPLGLLQEDSPQ
ncbi:MAG: 16S rRNA (guanine(527)-N(7))-methyltransferase RsmG, partial [Cyanobacteriota bacterium]